MGSRILSKKDLDVLYQKSRKYIRQLLNDSHVKPNLKAEMWIALAVINYAKGWDTEDESGFWRYIVAQFGYRDEHNNLRSLLCSCVKNALAHNNRWFVMDSRGNQFKSSILVHAFSTKRSWLFFCDFLFDFYKTNLNWEYIEDDPMIGRMVLSLRNKINASDDRIDEDIEISSRAYNFREGIRKLIVHRPKYAIQLVSKLIKRIDGLVNHTNLPAITYEEQICDEWMANKLQGIAAVRKKEKIGEKRIVAIDYTRIRPIYQLYNETEIRIVFPDVRLNQNEFSSLGLMIYNEGNLVEQKTLSFYGNELGKTMNGFILNLEDYLKCSGSAEFNPQIIITCDANEIYNSEKVLYRDCLVFKGKTEVDVSCCETGGYSIFTPTKAVTEINGAVVSDIQETTCIKGFYADLEKDFVINIDGEIVAFDNNLSSGELRIVVPDSPYAAEYIENGVRYSIVSEKEIIHIISSDFEKEKKYKLYINTDFINFESLPYEENTGVRIYKIEIAVPTIRVIDNANVEWNGTNTYWIKDIPQERFVDVKAPAGINVEMTLNGNSIDTESRNKFALGNAVYGFSNFGNERWLEIELNVSAPSEAAQTYTLGRIAVNEQFIEAPVLKLEGEKLSWNGGYGFIGDKNSGFQITICEGTEFERTFNLQLENELIAENVELPLGEYKYSISKQSGNLFAMQSTKLVSESMFVGDVNELRFLKNIIQIDTITFEDDTKYEAVDIRTCYIDQIKYKGIRYVGSENRDCPIYTGILYFVSNSRKRHEYSYENTIDDRGHHIYQINPVRIVFINDNTLSLTNETGNMDEVGDGSYYYYFDKDKMEKIYQLTDWEQTKFNRNKYYLADLYSYIRKEI